MVIQKMGALPKRVTSQQHATQRKQILEMAQRRWSLGRLDVAPANQLLRYLPLPLRLDDIVQHQNR